MRTGFRVWGWDKKPMGFWPGHSLKVGPSGELWVCDGEGQPFVVIAPGEWSRAEDYCEDDDDDCRGGCSGCSCC